MRLRMLTPLACLRFSVMLRLLAVQVLEVEMVPPQSGVLGGIFDLHHLGAHVGEVPHTRWTSTRPGEINDFDFGQGRQIHSRGSLAYDGMMRKMAGDGGTCVS